MDFIKVTTPTGRAVYHSVAALRRFEFSAPGEKTRGVVDALVREGRSALRLFFSDDPSSPVQVYGEEAERIFAQLFPKPRKTARPDRSRPKK